MAEHYGIQQWDMAKLTLRGLELLVADQRARVEAMEG